MKQGLVVAIVLWLVSAPVQAESIFRACVSSQQGTGQLVLCSCIQQVADQTLTERDKRLVVRFFEDPEQAHEIRHSERRIHERFWERYEWFGRSAEALCKR